MERLCRKTPVVYSELGNGDDDEVLPSSAVPGRTLRICDALSAPMGEHTTRWGRGERRAVCIQ